VQPVPIYADGIQPVTPAAAVLRPVAQRGEGESSSHDDASNAADDHSSRGAGHASHGDDRFVATERARESDDTSGSIGTTSTTRRSGHGETPEADRSESDSSPGGQSPSTAAPADNGGVTATTANPVVTVTVPTGDAPPTLGGSTPAEAG
jgi:hypothetical protein